MLTDMSLFLRETNQSLGGRLIISDPFYFEGVKKFIVAGINAYSGYGFSFLAYTSTI